MFKRGITSLEELLAPDDGRARIIAAGLLLELDGLAPERAASARQRIIRGLMLRNTTGKTTWADRFREIDAQVAPILTARFPRALSCLDMGASDGSTSLDLYRALREIEELDYLITDLNGELFVRKGRLWTDACDDDGHMIQTAIGPFVIPITRISDMHPLQLVNRFLFLITSVFRKKKCERAWAEPLENPGARPPFTRVSLLSEEVQATMAREPGLRFARLDLFAPPAREFDFVRVMNVLNLKTGKFGFSEDGVRRGLQSARSLVKEGGLLLLGRMVGAPGGNTVTNATLFEKSEGRLRPDTRFGSGSELEPFLDDRANRG